MLLYSTREPPLHHERPPRRSPNDVCFGNVSQISEACLWCCSADTYGPLSGPAYLPLCSACSSYIVQLEDQESGDDVAVPSISRQLLKLLQPRSQEEHQVPPCGDSWTCISKRNAC